jgi:hypothetical protein
MSALDNGLLNVPPPILSRVFQELEKAMVEYNQVMQIMTISFPFPYAQVSVVMIWFYMLIAPLVLVEWTTQPPMAALFAFISSTCFLCLELTAAELDQPFGEDANDLPCHVFQDDMNAGLLLLIEPSATMGFELGPTVAQHAHLIDQTTWRSFEESFQSRSVEIQGEQYPDDDAPNLPITNHCRPDTKTKAASTDTPVTQQVEKAAASPRAAATKPQIKKQSLGDHSHPKQSPSYLERNEGESSLPSEDQGIEGIDVDLLELQKSRDVIKGKYQNGGITVRQIPIQIQTPDPIAGSEGLRLNSDLEKELVKVLEQIGHKIDSSGGWLQLIHDSLSKAPMVRLASDVRLERTLDSNSAYEIQI